MKTTENLAELIRAGQNSELEQALVRDASLAEATTPHGISLLQYAAYCRNQRAIELLKTRKKKIDLHEAASIGELEITKRHLEDDPDLLNAPSADGFTPLGLSAYFGHNEAVEWLLNHEADPNKASDNDFKVAPLHSACAISDYAIAQLLISHGADVNAKQMNGVTPLHSAAHNGQTALVKLLLESGADPNARADDGKTPLDMAEEKNFKETAGLIRQQINS